MLVVQTSSVSRLPVSQQSGRLEIFINLSSILLIKISPFFLPFGIVFIDYCTRASWHFTDSQSWLSSKFLTFDHKFLILNLIQRRTKKAIENSNLITGIAGLHGTLTENILQLDSKSMWACVRAGLDRKWRSSSRKLQLVTSVLLLLYFFP
jgi:hypothetical protein